MRQFFQLSLRLAVIVSLGLAPAMAGAAFAAPSKGFSAFAVDVYTGKVLVNLNGDVERYPASITKVMTLYVLFQEMKAGRFSKNSRLTVSARAAGQAPSKLGLKAGDVISVDDAIKGVVTRSANDAAVTIAENISGSEAAFAERMTRTARALGMTRTQYRNASGLPNPGQISTARDIATLSLRIQRDFPQYYPYFRISSFSYRGKTIGTHNKLLGRFAGTDGIKTGYIGAAGFNLTTSAARGDKRLVGVVLGGASGPARDRYMIAMLDSLFTKVSPSKTRSVALLAGTPPGLTTAVATTSPVVGTAVKLAAAEAIPPKPEARPVVVEATQEDAATTASNDPSEDDAEDGVPTAQSDPASQPEFDQAGVALVAQAAQEDPSVLHKPSNSVTVVQGSTTVVVQAPVEAPAEPKVQTVPFAVKVASAEQLTGPAGADELVFPAATSEAKSDNMLAATSEPAPAQPAAKPLKQPVMASLAGETISPASDPQQPDENDPVPAVAKSSWNIQVGASPTADGAQSLIDKARKLKVATLGGKPSFTLSAPRGNGQIYRARFAGFTEKTARAACKQLERKGLDCLALQPEG